MKLILKMLLCFLIASSAQGQTLPRENLEELRIQIISELGPDNPNSIAFRKKVEEEIEVLLLNRRTVAFDVEYCNCGATQVNELLNNAFANSKIDIVIAIGPLASGVLAKRKTYSKPAIASLIIDKKTQKVAVTAEGTSGISNFTYIQSPFSFEKDLNLLYEVYPYKKIGVITAGSSANLFPGINNLYGEIAAKLGASATIISAEKDAATTLARIPSDVDAIYIMPFFNEITAAQERGILEGLMERKLPSVALFGETVIMNGAMLGFEAGPNLSRMPRRIGLNVSKIVDGINASTLPVNINTFNDNVVINMNTVRKVGVYPNWDMMTEAILLNANEPTTDVTMTLQTTIMEALRQNLGLKATAFNPLVAEKEVELAKSKLLPQLDLNSSIYLLDQNTAEGSFGTKGRTNWEAGASLSQIVYAEPALANVAIQKYLMQGEEAGLETNQLDVVLEAVEKYLNVLQARSFMEIQSANVAVTKSNLDISEAKDSVGYSGATDLNRWISQLALSKIDLNDAQTQFRQAKYALNQTLNQDIKADYGIEDVSLDNNMMMVTDERMINKINNEIELDMLSDFFVKEAMVNLPELQQFDYNIAALDRLALSQKRAFYLPTVGLNGSYDQTLQQWNVKESVINPNFEPEPSWNVGLGLQFPIIQGGARKYNEQKTKVNILQLETQRADARNQLELRVRVFLQDAVASYFEVQRFKEANTAAAANFDIVQDAYSQGIANITSLIDAQNAKVQTAIGVAAANYEFLLDFFEVERAIGNYYNLYTPAERDAFFNRLEAFMDNR